MNIINFNNSELLGYSHTCNYWGNIRNYSNTQNYSLGGYVSGLTYSENISGVVGQIDEILKFTTGLSSIYVNGLSVGTGVVKSINFQESNDLLIRRYSASIEIPLVAGSGMFSNSGHVNDTGVYFQSYGENLIDFFNSETGRYIKDFSLDQSSKKIGKDKYTYSKSASFLIDVGFYEQYNAKPEVYAAQIFGAISRSHGSEYRIFSGQYPDLYKAGSGISQKNQTFDILNGSFSYDESFTYQLGIPYIWIYNHSFGYDGTIAKVTEKGSVQSTAYSNITLPNSEIARFEAARLAWIDIKTGIQSRCSGFLTGYGSLNFLSGQKLSTYPANSSLTKNAIESTIEYSQSFSTSPFLKSGYVHTYENSIDYGQDGYLRVNENGSFKSLNNVNKSGMSEILNFYSEEGPSITGRISGLFNKAMSGYNYSCGMANTISEILKKETYNEYEPDIKYSLQFSSNPNYIPDAYCYSNDVKFNEDKSVDLYNYFPILNEKIYPQDANQIGRSSFSNKINLKAKTGVSISGLTVKALGLTSPPTGDATDLYIQNYKYSYSPNSRGFALSLDYVYTQTLDQRNYDSIVYMGDFNLLRAEQNTDY